MKKLFFSMVALACLLFVTSCSNSESNELLSAIPDDADFVLVGNIETILKSSGSTIVDGKLKLSKDIDDLFGDEVKDFDDLYDAVKNSGVKYESFALILVNNFKQPVFVLAINDTKKFVNYIEDNGFREKDNDNGITYYAKCTYESTYDSSYNNYAYIGLHGDIAYIIPDVWAGSDFKPVKAIDRLVENSKEKSFAKNKVSAYICEGNAAGLACKLPRQLRQELRNAGIPSSMLDFYEGYVCAKADLNGDKATVDVKIVNEDGSSKDMSQFNKYMDMNAKIGSQALKYLHPDESLVFACALKDVKWDQYLDMITELNNFPRSNRAQLTAIVSYLEKINGTIAFGLGVTNGLESFFSLDTERNILDNLVFTAVVETVDGKAKSMMNDLKGLLDNIRLPYEDTKNGFSLTIPQQGQVYAEFQDNYLIFSTKPIKEYNDNNTVKKVDFNNQISALGIYLDRNNKLLTDLRLDYDAIGDLTANPKDCSMSMTLQLKGGDKDGFIAKIFEIANNIYTQRNRLENLVREYRQSQYQQNQLYEYDDVQEADDYDYDEVIVDIAE